MTAIAWSLLALSALVPPGRRAVRSDGGSAVSGADRRRDDGVDGDGKVGDGRRDRLLAPVAGLGVAAIAVVLMGGVTGLVVSVVAGPAAAAAAEWLRRRPSADPPDRSLALCLDLVAAMLRSGRPVAAALTAAAPSARAGTAAALVRVARLLELGAEPGEAWRTCAAPGSVLGPVAAVAVRSQTSGIRLADAFERLAVELRAECTARAAARAQRAGVHAMGPLAACFLPSFVCLGIVPVVVGIARTALHGVG